MGERVGDGLREKDMEIERGRGREGESETEREGSGIEEGRNGESGMGKWKLGFLLYVYMGVGS